MTNARLAPPIPVSPRSRHAFAEPLTSLAAGSAAGARWLAHATFVGVYDGHGGAQCSQFLKEELGGALVEELLRGGGATALPASPDAEAGPTAAELRAALERAFLRIDAAFLKMAEGSSCRAGTTAVVAVVTHSALAVAHVGDSRALAVYSDRSSEFLTTDHKPNNPAEFARIEAAGGEVVKRGPVWRVSTKGASSWQSRCRAGRVAFTEQPPVLLAVSRAFGNKDLKRPLEIVTARPEVRLWAMGGEDDAPTAAVVLCSDGVWDVLSASDVAGHVFKALDKAGERCVSAARDAAAGVCAAAESRGSMDNVTAAVCLLGV